MVGLRRPPAVETPAVEPPAPSAPPARNKRLGPRWWLASAAGAVVIAGLAMPWAIGPEPVLQGRPAPVFKNDPSPPPASEGSEAAGTDSADVQTFAHAQLLPPAVVPALLPPVGVAPPPEQQAWRRNAVAVADPRGRPMVAIVIDDLGLDRRNADRVVPLGRDAGAGAACR